MLGLKEWPVMLLFACSFLIAGIATILVTITEWQSNTIACREYKLNGKAAKTEGA
jgi:uncharacterized membrane protein HdeD (DUF308 family)